LSRFTKRGFHTDAAAAVTVELLNEVPDNFHAKRWIYSSAMVAIGTRNGHQPGDIDADDLQADKPISSMLPLSINDLVRRLKLCEQTDDPHALDEVISLHYEAMKYHGWTHSSRSVLLNNLSYALITRFGRRGSDKDLDEAIVLNREALTLRPVGHPDRPSSLNCGASFALELNLGFKFGPRFDRRWLRSFAALSVCHQTTCSLMQVQSVID